MIFSNRNRISLLPRRIDHTNLAPYVLGESAEECVHRAEAGFSEEDTFSFDTYLAGVIAEGVERLRARSIGYPHGMTEAEWDDVLRRIVKGFREYNDEKRFFDRCTPAYEDAFDLLREHFPSLWD